jgi:signal transduction histidine kinase
MESRMSAPSEPSAPPEGEAHAVDPAGLADFLASLAHDLRSPLGVVAEAVAELRSDFAAALTDDHRVLLSLAERGLGRLGRLADTVSLAAALDSGSFELKRRPVDLVALIRDAVATAGAIEPRREVTLVCELPAEHCPAVADADRLARAVVEVVINAVRHARGRVRVRLELASGEARAAIEDDGQGVAASRRATLFVRFAPRASRSGLGLGLSIAHDVIVAHGGRIALEASTLPPGRPGAIGARFVISLPTDAAGA